MNGITERQLLGPMLDLVRARRLVYRRAKRCQGALVTVTLLLPVAAALSSALWPAARPAVALFAVLLGIFEVTSIDRWMKARLKEGAKLQEQFDCQVLDISWNEFVVGAQVDAEDVFENACENLSASDEQRLRDWYPMVVADAPIEIARLICQRENLVYDSEMRIAYGRVLLWSIVCFVGVAGAAGLYFNFTFTTFVLGALVPAAPALTWALRERKRQTDTVETLARLKTESENLIRFTMKDQDPAKARGRARELQDAVYSHRLTSSLVFEWLYRRLRPRLESKLSHGAAYWVDEYRRTSA